MRSRKNKRLSFTVLALVILGLLVAAPRIAANGIPLLELLNGNPNAASEAQPLPVPTAVIASAIPTVASQVLTTE